MVGSLASSLASIHYKPAVPPTKAVTTDVSQDIARCPGGKITHGNIGKWEMLKTNKQKQNKETKNKDH